MRFFDLIAGSLGPIQLRKIFTPKDEDLALLLSRGNLLHIPTTAWGEALVSSGAAVQTPVLQRVGSGTSASSSATLSLTFWSLSLNFRSADSPLVDWNKKLYIGFNYMRSNSDAQGVARFQLKQTDAIGALAAKGIGLRADNLALIGESYGTALGEVDLATTLTSFRAYWITIIHYPGSKIEWYVNSVLKGTQSTAANIPSGIGTEYIRLVHSAANGADGGVHYRSDLNGLWLWQER